MAAIPGEHYFRCGICQGKKYASEARLHYLGFYTCKACYEVYPEVLHPLPVPPPSRPLPAWKINVPSPIVFVDPWDTWSTKTDTWSTCVDLWSEA